MAEVTIRLRHNPKTGKRELIIGYESESDALPHEHEKDHRALAEQLLGIPLGDDIEGVRVERAPAKAAEEPPPSAPDKTPEKTPEKVSTYAPHRG